MNDKLKRCTAAGLMVIMLLVGFFAEYTHRHGIPSAGQPAVADTGSQPSGKSAGTPVSHDCFICQLTSVAVEITPTFGFAVLTVPQAPAHTDEIALACSAHFDISLRRGPPAFLA